MRYLLPFLILLTTGCSGQKTKEQQTQIDTLKLFDLKPEPPSAQDVQMFKNCMILFYPNYTVIHSGTEHTFDNLDSLTNFLTINADAIRQNKFYLISDSSTKYSKIVSAIDVLTNTAIDNYKVINYQEYFAPPQPVTIQTPVSTTSTYNENDSSYFVITILKNALEVKLFNQTTKLSTIRELDDFITKHKSGINSRKIMVISSSDLSYDKFKPIFEVLKKHDYYKYNLVKK
jgi:biopolymer transport protein ExbD